MAVSPQQVENNESKINYTTVDSFEKQIDDALLSYDYLNSEMATGPNLRFNETFRVGNIHETELEILHERYRRAGWGEVYFTRHKQSEIVGVYLWRNAPVGTFWMRFKRRWNKFIHFAVFSNVRERYDM